MASRTSGPVVCFSYLAAAELWQVARFPLANYGAEVVNVEHSIAADAPMAAAVLAALDVPTLLLANDIGTDQKGSDARAWLQRYGVDTTADTKPDVTTPQIVVVADDAGTRTWFPHLPGIVDTLTTLDLAPIAQVSFAYVDCYSLIHTAAARVIRTARAADIPLLLNLGGDHMSSEVLAALDGYPRLIVQTNITEESLDTATRLAKYMQADMQPAWAVITAGAAGAAAASARDVISVPAFQADVRHTHCAGAAFSGGLIYGLLHDWPMDDCLTLACASGALRCERAHHEPMPTLAELRAVIGSRERWGTAAA
jgi:sugar/nucleoside kinase (ribokinase family)